MLRPIIRALAVAALRDQTWAGSRVYDSDLRPFSTAVLGQEAPQPYIVVYTDADDQSPVVIPAQFYSGETRSLSLVVEIGSASAVQQSSGQTVIKFALTDEGQELVVDALETQVISALFGNPHSMWGDLLKSFINRPRRYITRRGGQNQSGVRFAARRLTFVVQPIWEISPSVKPGPNNVIWNFINLADQYPAAGCKDVADMVQFLMAPQSDASWRIAQSHLGLSTKAVKMLNVPGTPLPWGAVEGEMPVEAPPYDLGHPPLGTIPGDEFVPTLTDIELEDLEDTSTPPAPITINLWPDVFYYD